MANLYREFLELMPKRLLQVGEVIDIASGRVTVALDGGGQVYASGHATLGQRVFVRAEVIEGLAPVLDPITGEI